MKGAHGVTAEVFKEAWHPRHCALSLIGEALMYPHINQFLGKNSIVPENTRTPSIQRPRVEDSRERKREQV